MTLPGLRLCTVLLLVSAAASWAATPRALAKEADRLYKQGKYREAVDRLREAYQSEPNPVYLFNLARALDQAGEVDAALDAYRQYVSQKAEDTQPELVKKANLAMDRLRTFAAKAEAERAQQEAERKRLDDERQKAELKAAEETRAALEQRQAYEAKERAAREAEVSKVNGRRVGALVLGGTAVAAIGTAVGFGLWANGSKRAFLAATTLQDKARLEADTKTQALVADLALVAGLATAVGAVILFPKGPAPSGHVTVGVVPVTGGGLATLGGLF